MRLLEAKESGVSGTPGYVAQPTVADEILKCKDSAKTCLSAKSLEADELNIDPSFTNSVVTRTVRNSSQ
jgi:hypothetical protein